MNNRFYDLPYELQILCYKFSNKSVISNFRKNYYSAFIIQSFWRRYLIYRSIIRPFRQKATLFID